MLGPLLHAVKQSRFTPAQGASGRPVAVNMVWVIARTTVTRDAQLEELLNSAPQRHPVVDRVERAVPVPETPKPARVVSPATRLELPRTSSTAPTDPARRRRPPSQRKMRRRGSTSSPTIQ